MPAEAAGLVAFWPEVRFFHPLVRSAVYYAATAVQRRQAHRALAAACDPERDVVPGHGIWQQPPPGPAKGRGRAGGGSRPGREPWWLCRRGLVPERAALLTPDQERRAERRLSAAQAHLLCGDGRPSRRPAGRGQQGPARPAVDSAGHPSGGHDPVRSRARGEGCLRLGRCGNTIAAARPGCHEGRTTLRSGSSRVCRVGVQHPLLHEIARTARDLPLTGDPTDETTDLLLQGFTGRVTGGYAPAVPALRRAVRAFLADELDPRRCPPTISTCRPRSSRPVGRRRGGSADHALDEPCPREGALAKLAGALGFRSALVDGPGGRLAAARAAESEVRELAEVTHNPGVVPPSGAATLPVLVLSGQESEARATAAAVAPGRPRQGAAGEAAFAEYWLGVLEISLGNYGSAVECLHPAYTDDTPLVGTQVLPDLVEAAVRAGRQDPGTARPPALRRTARPLPALHWPWDCSPGPGLCWSARPRPARSMRMRCTCSAGPGPLPNSLVPTCSMVSGCAASIGGGRPVISCAQLSTYSTAWACPASPSGRVWSCGPRVSTLGSGS